MRRQFNAEVGCVAGIDIANGDGRSVLSRQRYLRAIGNEVAGKLLTGGSFTSATVSV